MSFSLIRSVAFLVFGVFGICAGPALAADAVLTAGQKTKALPAPNYVGVEHCGGCHTPQVEDWRNSHHDLAMQTVSAATVLGDFNDAEFEYAGITSRFYQQDEQFIVRTDGPTGALEDYPVRYVFGVYPLQQYLLELPQGRLQALSIAWDSRTAAEGGQRWFHLYPDAAFKHTDALHWTGRGQNWNFMCAECHSTHLDKNYDAKTDSYDTQWSEIDVSCEACHGPASNHLLWADEGQRQQYSFGTNTGLLHRFTEREGVSWAHNSAGQPERSQPRQSETEIQVCAACHSRRAQLFEDDRQGQALMDSYLPSTLDAGLYHADGQVNDEVYVYGSFIQSKMYAAGVTCSDCHNPHSLALKIPGDGVCLQCHQPSYQTEQHHFHASQKSDQKTPGCVDCHMPAKNFMVVDERQDHSFRIPRPDLSVALGVPNTCNQCHADQSAEWAAQQVKNWYGEPRKGHQQFAEILAAARTGQVGAAKGLLVLLADQGQPAIARATAARELTNYMSNEALQTLSESLQDADPMVRMAGLQTLEVLPMEMRWRLAYPLLDDKVRVVRAFAASALAVPRQQLPSQASKAMRAASQEFETAQRHNADTPESYVNLGQFWAQQGQTKRAETAYKKALEKDGNWLPAYINLVDLYRLMGRDDQGEKELVSALQRFPDAADLHHSLGLLKVRQKLPEAGLVHLRKAAELAPENSRYLYVYAVGLHSLGRTQTALQLVNKALQGQADASLLELKAQLEASAGS